jgi:hypothetical protein
MNAITVRQPYAGLIVRGLKTAEYRSWKIPTGIYALHAGRALPTVADIAAIAEYTGMAEAQALAWADNLPRGKVLAIIEVTGHARTPEQHRHRGEVANLLQIVREFARPVPAVGRLGIWEWNED